MIGKEMDGGQIGYCREFNQTLSTRGAEDLEGKSVEDAVRNDHNALFRQR